MTELGAERVDELYTRAELAGLIIDDVYEAFAPINDEVKGIVTDWQMRSVGGSSCSTTIAITATTRWSWPGSAAPARRCRRHWPR